MSLRLRFRMSAFHVNLCLFDRFHVVSEGFRCLKSEELWIWKSNCDSILSGPLMSFLLLALTSENQSLMSHNFSSSSQERARSRVMDEKIWNFPCCRAQKKTAFHQGILATVEPCLHRKRRAKKAMGDSGREGIINGRPDAATWNCG